jgi:hypothetical protein
MTSPHTIADLIDRLTEVQHGVAQTVVGMTQHQFDYGTDAVWSPSSYLKHLLLSNKPFVKALGLPKEQLETLFGLSADSARTFADVVEIYTARIAAGIRAEDNPQVTPVTYRMPQDVTDERAYLVETWNTAHENLFKVLQTWSEEALDRYQLPHPVMGLISVRAMLFFTLHHNTMHWRDIQQGGV